MSLVSMMLRDDETKAANPIEGGVPSEAERSTVEGDAPLKPKQFAVKENTEFALQAEALTVRDDHGRIFCAI